MGELSMRTGARGGRARANLDLAARAGCAGRVV